MKKILTLMLAVAALGSANAQPSVGVSIGINQPGVYGRINIGDLPRPALILPQPVIIAPAPVQRPPIYLYVPAAHQQNWRRYCGRYNACGQPVYFVQESWVRQRYEAEHPGWGRGRHRGWEDHGHRDHDRGWDHEHDRGHGHDRGPGHGRGHNH
ncbi:hypothetical protein [Variovorax sp. PBL-E5]|uniref:hypothetical protein n=1 Tax=Variovorax sp. PBL-E5 TaxID=434014 RepID=UPI001317C63A|nr:hypothetical protein [Variovorax sp. PBL-E5]VTU25138.1 hypothetical protein E5CHR_01935 [Variovorax sp. PBL-E5]